MNDENLEIYLYKQFNDIIDSPMSNSQKQKKFGELFIMASNSISAIYLVNHEEQAKEMMRMAGGQELNFKKLLENEWYVYTNIEIWIDFLDSVYNEIEPTHPQYDFFNQVMSSIQFIQRELGIKKETLLS